MYWVRKDTLHHIIQKLKHRLFRRLLPREQRFLFVVVCLFVFFPTKCFGWLATSCLCFVSRHANDFVSVMV